MVHHVQPHLFADEARQRQYEALADALAATTPAAVLLGNLTAWTDLAADALLVLPNCLAMIFLVPGAGRLDTPELAHGTWQLDGHPLANCYGAANPFAQYRAQQPAVLAWVAEQLGRPAAELPPLVGLAVFEGPLAFGPTVEPQLLQVAGHFQLVGEVASLPARLAAIAAPTPLPAPELAAWADYLLAETATDTPATADPTPAEYLADKLRQLWRWLGAADIPADPPYGAPYPAAGGGEPAEQHLRQLRQELRSELRQQRQEAAQRETAHQQELARLRQQVLGAGPAVGAPPSQATEAALRTARAELATRTQELDRRIRELGQLIGQLRAAPPAGPGTIPTTAPLVLAATRRAGGPGLSGRRQAARWGLVALTVAGLGAGAWGLRQWLHPPARPVAGQQLASLLPAGTDPSPTDDDNSAPDTAATSAPEPLDTAGQYLPASLPTKLPAIAPDTAAATPSPPPAPAADSARPRPEAVAAPTAPADSLSAPPGPTP